MLTTALKDCGHYGQPLAGICKACGVHYCRECGSPQVVRVRKTHYVHQLAGHPTTAPIAVESEFGEMWPLCHACAAKMPPVWVEPAPPPPVTTTITNKTNAIDWSRAVKMFEALQAGKMYLGIGKEKARGTAHEWQPLGDSPVVKLLKQEQAKQPKPKKPKPTPQSVLEADVEKFLRESDDD